MNREVLVERLEDIVANEVTEVMASLTICVIMEVAAPVVAVLGLIMVTLVTIVMLLLLTTGVSSITPRNVRNNMKNFDFTLFQEDGVEVILT